jgi:hypothetical protein
MPVSEALIDDQVTVVGSSKQILLGESVFMLPPQPFCSHKHEEDEPSACCGIDPNIPVSVIRRKKNKKTGVATWSQGDRNHALNRFYALRAQIWSEARTARPSIAFGCTETGFLRDQLIAKVLDHLHTISTPQHLEPLLNDRRILLLFTARIFDLVIDLQSQLSPEASSGPPLGEAPPNTPFVHDVLMTLHITNCFI